MIELDVNGHQSWVEPESIETLEAEIARALPEGHEVCTLWVNGDQLGAPQLGMLPLGDVHNVRVDSGLPSALARSALP